MRWSITLLYVAMVIFLASAAAILMSLENGSRALALAGGLGNVIAGVLFVLSIWLPRKRVDWERIEAEQRLWESGPLGRKWLRVRRRIYDQWKR
jgi:hypothetical protein